MSREPFDAPTALASDDAQNVPGNAFPGTAKKARKADRKAAYRATHARLDVATTPRIADTIASLATDLGASRNEVVNSLLRFALTNRNWRQQGLWGAAQTKSEAQS